MVSFKPLDPEFPIERQLNIDAGPVVLVNLFTVDPVDQVALVEAWKSDAQWMKKQPGYISTQLHKAVGDGSMYLNYADTVLYCHNWTPPPRLLRSRQTQEGAPP